jgi:hypothetical protein
MLGLVKWAFVVALSVWLGAIVFFSFVGAPGVFGAFPESQRAEAGRVIARLFPGYYRMGYACGVVLLLASVILAAAAREGASAWVTSALVAALMLGATLYAGTVVQPRVHELRLRLHEPDLTVQVKEEFDRLHRRAVQLNVVVLIGAIILTGVVTMKLRS